MSLIATPSSLPRPKFAADKQQTFSHKKDRRAPAKTCPPPPRPVHKTIGLSHSLTNTRAGHALTSSRPRSIHFDHVDDVTRDYIIRTQPFGDDDNTSQASQHDCSYGETSTNDERPRTHLELNYDIMAKIGEGQFGNVYKVKSKIDGQMYAVKVAREVYFAAKHREIKLEEVRKHQLLPDHANCVKFFRSWEERDILYQQFELCAHSLDSDGQQWAEPDVWACMTDMLRALQHLHAHDLIHMDVKPANIFVVRDPRQGGAIVFKLGDFGMAVDLRRVRRYASSISSSVQRRLNRDGTPRGSVQKAGEVTSPLPQQGVTGGDSRYMADEVLHGHISSACDVFSLGIAMLELATDLDLPSGGDLWHRLRGSSTANEAVLDRNSEPTLDSLVTHRPPLLDDQLVSHLSRDLVNVLSLMMDRNWRSGRPSVDVLLQMEELNRRLCLRKWSNRLEDIKHRFRACWIAAINFCTVVVMFMYLIISPPTRPSLAGRKRPSAALDGCAMSGSKHKMLAENASDSSRLILSGSPASTPVKRAAIFTIGEDQDDRLTDSGNSSTATSDKLDDLNVEIEDATMIDGCPEFDQDMRRVMCSVRNRSLVVVSDQDDDDDFADFPAYDRRSDKSKSALPCRARLSAGGKWNRLDLPVRRLNLDSSGESDMEGEKHDTSNNDDRWATGDSDRASQLRPTLQVASEKLPSRSKHSRLVDSSARVGATDFCDPTNMTRSGKCGQLTCGSVSRKKLFVSRRIDFDSISDD